MAEMRNIAEQSRELHEYMKQKTWEWTGWMLKIIDGLGLNISGWIQSLKYVLMFIVLLVVVCVGLSCVQSSLVKTFSAHIRVLQVHNPEYVPLFPSPIREEDEPLNPSEPKFI